MTESCVSLFIETEDHYNTLKKCGEVSEEDSKCHLMGKSYEAFVGQLLWLHLQQS